MVTLNLTFFIELGLFLIFLWGTSKFILPQVVRLHDEREHAIEEDHAQARTDIARAEELERQYDRETAAARRASDDRLRDETRHALDRFAATLAAKKAECDEAVAAARESARAEVEAQRDACTALAPEIAALMAEQLGTGERTE